MPHILPKLLERPGKERLQHPNEPDLGNMWLCGQRCFCCCLYDLFVALNPSISITRPCSSVNRVQYLSRYTSLGSLHLLWDLCRSWCFELCHHSELPDYCNSLHFGSWCFDFVFQGKWSSPITGSFVQSTKASQDWKATEGERRRKKGLWFSDRWGGFIWLQRLQELFRLSFWLSFCSFSGWSKACDVPQSILEAYPCCCKQRIQTITLSLGLAQHVNGYFSPFSAFSPFSLPFWHSFLLVALFCTQCPVALK